MFTPGFVLRRCFQLHLSFRHVMRCPFAIPKSLRFVGIVILLAAICFGQQVSTSRQQLHAKAGTRLITLGTAGGPVPVADRTQSSNLLIVNGALYLIDAGDDVTRRIVQSGSDFRQIGKVFLTHAHSDHTLGLATLMNAAWEFQRSEPMDIFGPPGIERLVSGAVNYLFVNAEIRSAEGKLDPLAELFHVHALPPGLVFQDANIKVTAAENSHYHFPSGSRPYGKHKSYSYRFDTPDRVVVFTGDSGPSDSLTALAKGTDVLVTEVLVVEDALEVLKRNGSWNAKTPDSQQKWLFHMKEEHMTPEQAAKLAANAGAKTLVMTHLPPTVNPREDYQGYIDSARKYFPGRIVIAKDLGEF